MFDKLKKVTMERINSGETITGLSPKEVLGNIDEQTELELTGKKEVTLPKDNTEKVVKKELTVSEIVVYSFLDKIRNANPNQSQRMLVLLLETFLAEELDRVEKIKVPKDTIDDMKEIMSKFMAEFNRVVGE